RAPSAAARYRQNADSNGHADAPSGALARDVGPMIDEPIDPLGDPFDDALALALAQSAHDDHVAPGPHVKDALLARLPASSAPQGFAMRTGDEGWRPHAVRGIRMRVLSLNARGRYAVLLLDVAPGTRFPAHHHSGAEECYVISGSLFTCGRRLG